MVGASLIQCLLFPAAFAHIVGALDNGLALTPPMGWMSWQRFKCTTDCRRHPQGCISEDLIKRTVKAMVSEGYVAAGYDYVAIDDCWMDKARDANGNLRPDPKRFPNGIKHLSDFVHDRGMKLGIYGAVGPTTCMRYPGNAGHVSQDAIRYAEWGVDMFKLDGCFVPLDRLEPAYVSMSKSLNQTSRHIAYLCSWPYYILLSRKWPPWEEIRRRCNMWRVADDVSESLASILNIIDTYEKLQSTIAPLAGPGSWNDADQLLIGNDGLSEDDCRIQMAMWAILTSPLFMSVDLDEIEPWAKSILLNERVIAINQDPLGRQGIKLAGSPSGLGIWVKELTGSRLAIAFLRVQQKHWPEDATLSVPVHLSVLKPKFPGEVDRKFRLTEVFDDEVVGIFSFDDKFVMERGNDDVATVMLLTLTLLNDSDADDRAGARVDGVDLERLGNDDDDDDEVVRNFLGRSGRRRREHWTDYVTRLVPCALLLVVVIVVARLRHFIYRKLVA